MSIAVMVYKISLLKLRKVKAMRYSFELLSVSSFFLNDTQGNSFTSVLIFPHKSIPLYVKDTKLCFVLVLYYDC